MDRVETIKLFTLISNAYDHFEVNKEKVELWSSMLADKDFEIVAFNLRDHIQREKFPPSIADLRREIPIMANAGANNKTEILRIEGMRQEATKKVPKDIMPDFIKEATKRGE